RVYRIKSPGEIKSPDMTQAKPKRTMHERTACQRRWDQWCTLAEVLEALDCSKTVVRRLRREGLLGYARDVVTHRRYWRPDVERLAAIREEYTNAFQKRP